MDADSQIAIEIEELTKRETEKRAKREATEIFTNNGLSYTKMIKSVEDNHPRANYENGKHGR
jgi:hypothetical protein